MSGVERSARRATVISWVLTTAAAAGIVLGANTAAVMGALVMSVVWNATSTVLRVLAAYHEAGK